MNQSKKKRPFPKNFKKFVEEQLNLAQEIKICPLRANVKWIAGVDCAYTSDEIICAATVWDVDEQKVVDKYVVRGKVKYPYVPGFLYLREGPFMVKAVKGLKVSPEVILVDGQGILHPRKMGVACYVGVKTGLPAVGVAKNRLAGIHDRPGNSRGSYVPVKVNGEIRGAFLVTRDGVKGVYVSPGHLCDVSFAVNVVLHASVFRIPEPIRQAHILANREKRKTS